ncbi:MAG: Kae1-associated serine/threonine protein kinase [Candidatus Thermoplasmatota archaeon]|nr:Kae1-associated serine/threonine protein kinase [Candidatus Thermoplasmatota archaeon]
MGRRSVEKWRRTKGYRHPQLDSALRSSRIKTEVRLYREARRLGVPVPILYDVDLAENRIVLEFVEGPTAKEVLTSGAGGARDLCYRMGLLAGRLHAGDIIHGDLTTSNMILRGDRLYLVDFGLGEKSGDIEAKGVDLHLLREAFMSAHSDMMGLFDEVLRGYRDAYNGAETVICKVGEIEKRGRYVGKR